MRAFLVLSVLSVAAGCGGGGSSARPVGVDLSVDLWHCGVEPVTVEGRVWEVPHTERLDGHPDLPVDATTRRSDWVGRGTAVVAGDVMVYIDGGGEVITFVPDDGEPPGPCA